ncbi:helix-turn-helix transcriptional regulator [Gemmiger formicilis]|uniref:helix-turn-helix domain-containing protein n=1 Tax=Gemmiger formicilis TaxID=745368 RepID=UPI0019562ED8|nr:helix-turn-helix transcriptional regulator [Gemmiger formicilis]MBM6898325.1 helix-turn-helix transcriptional regulator [Gemmiger formicilis]
MDQSKTGKFIAQERRAQNLTQRQLADKLAISDKTVSKWECGKGLPEVSLMLPLCEILQITVNDLLSGEKVAEGDYQKKAEENMMDLIRENAENKERMTLSIICGVITIIAVCALVMLASYLELPAAVRILLLVCAVLTAIAGIGAAARLEVKAGYYECPHCGTLFVPTMTDYVKGWHTLTRRRLTCPTCGKTSMCRHRITR